MDPDGLNSMVLVSAQIIRPEKDGDMETIPPPTGFPTLLGVITSSTNRTMILLSMEIGPDTWEETIVGLAVELYSP
jgi:hypothetical protein